MYSTMIGPKRIGRMVYRPELKRSLPCFCQECVKYGKPLLVSA